MLTDLGKRGRNEIPWTEAVIGRFLLNFWVSLMFASSPNDEVAKPLRELFDVSLTKLAVVRHATLS